jgi:hypothetical protein
MIKSITPGTGITVNNSHSLWPSFYNTISSTGNTLIGQMRYNGNNQAIEVYDGQAWVMMSPAYPTIDLAPHVQAVITWAQNKMADEARIKELAAKHPSVADALQAVAHAGEQVRVVAALVDTE